MRTINTSKSVVAAKNLSKKALNIAAFAGAIFSMQLSAHDLIPGEPTTTPVFIKNGTIHTVTKGTLSNSHILIENGKIKAIGNVLEAPNGAQVIDATGKHIYPGFIALNSQLGLEEIGAVRATRDQSETGKETPEVKAHIAFNADSEIIPTVRANGITHAEIAPQGGSINGQSSVVHLDGWNWQDSLVKASSGMHMRWPRAGINKSWWERRPPEKQREDAAKALKAIDQNFEMLAQYNRLRSAIKNTPIDIRWEAMRSVMDGTMPLYIHANDYREIEQAINLANQYQLKIVLVGVTDVIKSADLIKMHNVPVVFTSAWGQPLSADDKVDSSFTIPAQMEKLGIPYALTVAGSWNSRDLPFAVGQSIAYGVSPEKGLASITIEPAKILGLDAEMGSIEVGKNANIIISTGDVFDHLTHKIETMLIDGRTVNLDNRHKRLYEKYSKK